MIFIADDDTLLMGSGEAVERELFDRLGGRPLPDLVGLEQERDALQSKLLAIRAELLRVCSDYTDDTVRLVRDLVDQLDRDPSRSWAHS